MKVSEALKIISGEVSGDPDIEFNRIAPIQTAQNGDLTFVSGKKYLKYLSTTNASIVILRPENKPSNPTYTIIFNDNPTESINKLLRVIYAEKPLQPYRSPTARVSEKSDISKNTFIGDNVIISDGVQIGDSVSIAANSFIGENVSIGEYTRIHPNVTIYKNTKIGRYVTIHAGAVIASDGFGYSGVDQHGNPHKVPQVGSVNIEDYVEIGANTTIDRGTLGDTEIGCGTKIDNLVQVAHNVRIGKRCLITAQVGIAGSTVIGDGVVIGGQAGFVDHIEIGEGTMIGAQSGISKSFPPGSFISGSPAKGHQKNLRQQAMVSKLEKLFEEVKKIKKKLE
ncbi:UDP-3-O-(3-hydroxymyristoyl)glucosamine N-acyltransferase [bacterium]|nr:UDP-3-O-(3-hydroxymyristoyl)glucosamine N-acyltransferase [bacterium]